MLIFGYMATSSEAKGPYSLFDGVVRSFLKKRTPLGGHAAFWLAFVFYESIVWGMVDGEYRQRFIISLIELPIKIAATYFTVYFLIDRFLVVKRYSTFLASLIVSMAVFGIALRVLGYYVLYPMFGWNMNAIPLFFPPKVLICTVIIYSVVTPVAFFHLLRYWYTHQQEAQRLHQATELLEKGKLEAELKLLKSQINPHFLFNTLNNLYALSLSQSAKAPEMVYRLSQLMSYMLYDGNQPEVPLTRELQYIQNYIALEKIRYDHRLDVSLNVYDDVEGVLLAPLLMLPFVENSFKHGACRAVDQSWIRIDVLRQDNTLVFKVENSKPCDALPNEAPIVSGIGLNNLYKRLELIYPEKHTVTLLDEQDTFLAILKIELPTLAAMRAGVSRSSHLPLEQV